MTKSLLDPCPHLFKRFTIQSQCKECAPELHQEYDQKMEAYMDVARRYWDATGKMPLDDWKLFEEWLKK